MDTKTTNDRYSGIGDVEPPKEIEIELRNGVRGTIAIPHAVDNDDFLELGYAPPTHKMAILLHGQAGHRNYCYQRMLAHKLAAELGMYSLRIDFRGNGDSAEVADPKVGRVMESDIEDVQLSAEFVLDAEKNPLNIAFDLVAIISHSRGSLAMFLWALQQQKLMNNPQTSARAIFVPNLINTSSRFRSHTVFDRYPVHDEEFEDIEQRAIRHGELRMVKITKQELLSLAEIDTDSFRQISPHWSVLSIYGSQDLIVPPEDSAYYANCFNRGPYTHHLELIIGADHNFYGVEVIENDSDMEDFNPHDLPLSRKKVVNYNYLVSAMVVKYLNPDQELLRFSALNEKICGFVPRMKTVDGVSNFRDMGGWPLYSPRFSNEADPDARLIVRPGLIYRCANTAQITASGLAQLQKLGIHAMFDLRSEEECEKYGVPANLDSVGVKRYHAPVFRHEDYSPDAIALRLSNLITSWSTYVNVYDQMLQNGTESFRTMFCHLRDNANSPMVFHCTAGKDRTGVFGMLVLYLAGVDRLTISKEYALTTYGLIPDHADIREKYLAGVDKLMSKENGEVMAKMIARGRKNWSVEIDGFNNLISSKAEAMLATLDLLDSKYGGIVNYMSTYLGFSMTDIKTIYGNIVCTETSCCSTSLGSGSASFGLAKF